MNFRKNNYFKHIFLIIIIAIILFPLFWVLSTSLRRDNAAFSTKLFSSRMTFQHYIDLITPPQNIPILNSELKKIINISGEYKEKDAESIGRDLDNYIDKLEIEYNNTMRILDDTKIKISVLSDFLTDSEKKVIENFYSQKTSEIEKIDKFMLALIPGNQDKLKYFKYHYLDDLESYNLSENEKKVFESMIPDVYMDFYKTKSEIATVIGQIVNSYEEFISENKAYFDENDLSLLKDTIQGYNSNYYKFGFKYSTWNREVNIKILKKIGNNLENYENDTLMNQWDNFNEYLKAEVKSIEEINSSYQDRFKEYLTILKSDVDNIFESKIKSYNDKNLIIESELSKIMESKNSIEQNSINILGNQQKESILIEQIKSNNSYLQEGLNIIESLLVEEPLVNNDPFYAKKVEGIFENSQELLKLLENTGYSSDEEMTVLYDYIRSFFNNRESIMERTGYSYADDAISVYNNSQLLLKPALEDMVEIKNQIKELLMKKAELENSIIISENRIDSLKNELETMREENVELNQIKNDYQSFGYLLKTLDVLDGAQGFEGVYEYFYSLKKFLEDYKVEPGNISYFTSEFMDEIFEYHDAMAIVINFNVQYENIKNRIAVINYSIDEFKKRKEYYISLKISGSPIIVTEVNQIADLSSEAYQSFSADLSRIGRKVIDFAENESGLFSKSSSDLRGIDGNIFNLIQIWQKKPEQQFMRWLFNTIIVSIFTAGLTVIVCALGAYPFSRMRFKGRKNGLLILLLVQMFPTFMGMIALYALLRFIGTFSPAMGLDTIGGLIFVYMGNIAFNMWLLKGYFDTIPDTLEESAMIDGATRFQTFWRIVMPLATPILAVVFLLVFMGTFQEFILARIVLQSPENYTFAVGLQSFAYGPYQMEWGLFTAAAMIGAIPMLILFLFMQKYLVSGLTQGAVKG